MGKGPIIGILVFLAGYTMFAFSCERMNQQTLQLMSEHYQKCAKAYETFPPHIIYEKCGAKP